MNWWNKVRIQLIKICGIKPFENEFIFNLGSNNKCILIGKNGSGKTTLLKAIEFFFNENKYFKTFSPKDFNLESPYITIDFQVNDEVVSIKKTFKILKSSISLEKTTYSNSKFDINITNFIDTAFVYYFSSDRLLTEKDNEFNFIRNSLLEYLNLQTIDKQIILDKNIKEVIINYRDEFLSEFKKELSFDYSLNLKTGLHLKLVWENSPFDTLGSGDRKQIALRVLYSYINSRKKGPSILLIDSVENHFDLQTLLYTLKTLNALPTALQVLTTFSKKVIESLDDYFLSIVNKNESSNNVSEIWGIFEKNGIIF